MRSKHPLLNCHTRRVLFFVIGKKINYGLAIRIKNKSQSACDKVEDLFADTVFVSTINLQKDDLNRDS